MTREYGKSFEHFGTVSNPLGKAGLFYLLDNKKDKHSDKSQPPASG